MPTVQSWPVFLLCLVPAYWLKIALHELGHLVAASLTKEFDVVGCGIGMDRPWIWRKVGRTMFFFGRPLTGGITLGIPSGLRASKRAMLLYTAGGPIATWLTLGIAYVLWVAGARADFVVALFYVSLWTTIFTLIPMTVHVGGMALRSDLGLIIDQLRGRGEAAESPGLSLETYLRLAQACRKMNIPRGESAFLLGAAALQAELGDLKGAIRSLEESERVDPGTNPNTRHLASAIRLQIMTSENPSLALMQLQTAEPVADGDATLRAIHDLIRGSALIDLKDAAAAPLLRSVVEYSRASRLPVYGATAQAYLLEAEPAKDPRSACLELFKNPHLSPLSAARLSAVSARQLAESGRLVAAQQQFVDAQQRVTAIASEIQRPETREAFMTAYGRLLRNAVTASQDGSPLFLHLSSEKQSRFSAVAALILIFGLFALFVCLCVAVGRNDSTSGPDLRLILRIGMVAASLGASFSVLGIYFKDLSRSLGLLGLATNVLLGLMTLLLSLD